MWWFCFQAKDGIRDLVRSRGIGDVYKRQVTDMGHYGEFDCVVVNDDFAAAVGDLQRIVAAARGPAGVLSAGLGPARAVLAPLLGDLLLGGGPAAG